MKYLKLFESFKSIPKHLLVNNLLQEAKDICLELNDANIRTECYYNNPYVLDGKSQPGFITIGMERAEFENDEDDDCFWANENLFVEWHEVEEVVDRLIDYFELNNWNLYAIMMDDDNLINPKEWIETLRKKVNYKFSGLTINFVEN